MKNTVKKMRPTATREYFLYQTMIGAWPIADRSLAPIHGESLREAKSEQLAFA